MVLGAGLEQLVEALKQSFEIGGFCLEGGVGQAREQQPDGFQVELGCVHHVPRLLNEFSRLTLPPSAHHRISRI